MRFLAIMLICNDAQALKNDVSGNNIDLHGYSNLEMRFPTMMLTCRDARALRNDLQGYSRSHEVSDNDVDLEGHSRCQKLYV